ncbi:T9SS type A sorting domain-containing protein [Mucilaginibacter sp. OK283]|uniref:T9SS type A sorting domain-containing protein n=1 Tax=Mucilaginibacter sp. OK283 TaxID=1881049 RepID=UPI0008D48AF8|nr:T9SS type A sorting domain-containing protein [Mucilaginibacter sp. OK283]SEO92214.1 Por secretion system C-terminal sorting domain-containing protein [Mucilaginibacter sp. OK283]
MKTRILLGVSLLFLVLFSKPATAASYYWTGSGGNTSWNNSGNWYNLTTLGLTSGSPSTSDDAYIGVSILGINVFSGSQQPNVNTAITCANLYLSNSATVTLTINNNLTVSGSININGPVTITGSATLKGATFNVGFTGTLTDNVNVTITGASTITNSYASIINIGSGYTLTMTGGLTVGSFSTTTLTLSGSGTASISGSTTFSQFATLTNSAILKFNSSATVTFNNSCSFTNSGTVTAASTTFTLQGTNNFINNSGSFTSTGGSINFTSGGTGGYFKNTNVFTISSSCTLTFGNSSEYLQNSGSGVFTASSSTINLSGASAYTDNSATFKATACTFNFNNGNYIKNSGTFTTQTGCVFNVSTSSAYILNTANYYDHGSTYNLSGYGSSFQNTGSSAVVVARGATFNGTTNTMSMTNSGTFTADSTSYINLGTYQSGLTNTGVFNAGTSGSSCTITLSAQACFITNTGSSSQSAYFNLGSTSIIDLSSGYQPVVTNTNNAYSFFTLMSDALGSAAFDQISSTGYNSGTVAIAGTYNIQRFVSGGNLSTNRGYRIFSSPTNITNAYSTSTTYTNYITLNTLKNSYTVYSSLTANTSYPGAFTAGPSGGTGFSYINPNGNSIIYFYDETKAVSNTSFSSGKHVGVTSIGASTVTLNGVGAVSMPVGNGYLLYYVGPNSRTDGTTGNPLDCYITNVGYVNQGDVTVALWYTPKNGSSNSTTGKLSYSLTTLTGGAGYNMVGNPYPSTINIATVLGHNSNISTAYLLNKTNSPGQAYYAYTANGTSAPGIGYALSGEGFLVRTTSGGNSLTFKETDKVATQQLTGSNLLMSAPKAQTLTMDGTGKSFKSAGMTSSLQTTSTKELDAQGNPLTGLYVKIEKDSLAYDYCGVYFRNDWQDKFDENLDALDLDVSSSSVLLSSLSSDGMHTAVKHFPDYKKGINIKLYANGKTDGLYNLKIEGIRNIDTNNYKITLLDHFKKDSLDIGRYKSYAFNILKSDTNSFGANRFELTIRQLPAARYQLASFTAQKATDGVLVTWRAYNEGDNYFYTLEKQQANGTDYTSLYQIQSNGGTIYKYTDKTPNTGNNIYRLKQVDLFGNITYSGLVSIYYDKSGGANMFSVYPNPIAETLNVNVTSGKSDATSPGYKLNIYDATGSLVMQKTADSNAFSQNVSQFKPGIYIVELKDNGGSSLGKAKFIKK